MKGKKCLNDGKFIFEFYIYNYIYIHIHIIHMLYTVQYYIELADVPLPGWITRNTWRPESPQVVAAFCNAEVVLCSRRA